MSAFIRADSTRDAASFRALALDIFRFQFANNSPYRAYCQRAGHTPDNVREWTDIPAMLASAFKDLDLTALPPADRSRVFHSSGTTQHRPSRHFHSEQTLRLYEESLLAWFKPHILPDLELVPFLILAPPANRAPHSSLAHMFSSVSARFGTETKFAAKVADDGSWLLDFDALRHPRTAKTVICGTAFSFVHWCDHLAERGQALSFPPGSRVFETGGYKGRSRSVPKAELHRMIQNRLGIPPDHILSEYGMSELSSQAYDRVDGSNTDRIFHFPPWARAVVISPETRREAQQGETGMLRIFDLANVGSVLAIQTEDLAVRRDTGFELIGRAELAEARGCSLMEVNS